MHALPPHWLCDVLQGRTHACMLARTHTRTHAATDEHMHTHTHTHTHTYTHTHAHTRTRTRARTHTYTHTDTHTHTHTHTQTHTHTHKHANSHDIPLAAWVQVLPSAIILSEGLSTLCASLHLQATQGRDGSAGTCRHHDWLLGLDPHINLHENSWNAVYTLPPLFKPTYMSGRRGGSVAKVVRCG